MDRTHPLQASGSKLEVQEPEARQVSEQVTCWPQDLLCLLLLRACSPALASFQTLTTKFLFVVSNLPSTYLPAFVLGNKHSKWIGLRPLWIMTYIIVLFCI